MLAFISLLVFITIFIVVYLLLSSCVPVNGATEMRLKALDRVEQGRTDIDEELGESFSKRILAPVITCLAERLSRFTPQSTLQMMEERLVMAGGVGKLSVEQFFLLCVFLAVALPIMIGGFLATVHAPLNKVVGLSMISFVVGLIFPILLLNQKIAARKMSMQRDLPDILDLLTVSVEAGLGFDGALAKLAEKMKGALVEEFNRVLQEIRMGLSRREALSAMGRRCDVPDVSLFTTSLVQADQLGVSIGNVLRVQSASIRDKRKQRAEEKAMKAPIKMMLPLVMFIFPTIFIVLLGPAVIQVFTTFMHK
jgi:tight adherence protein C